MNKIVNLDLLSHPGNWIIIFLILYLTALLAKVVFDAAQGATPIPFPNF